MDRSLQSSPPIVTTRRAVRIGRRGRSFPGEVLRIAAPSPHIGRDPQNGRPQGFRIAARNGRSRRPGSGPAVSAAETDGVPGARLLERERQLAALSAALTGARAGGGAVIVVQGSAGIGKSRLLAAACEHAAGHGMEVPTPVASSSDQEPPFGVTSELFEARLASGPGVERNRLLAGHASLAASLFDPAAVASSADPHALVRGLYWLTANIAGETGITRGRSPAAVGDLDRRRAVVRSFLVAVRLASRGAHRRASHRADRRRPDRRTGSRRRSAAVPAPGARLPSAGPRTAE